MLIALHKNATTTPAVRAAIQQATGSDYELARQFNVSRDMVRKWRKRDGVHDASHTAHRLQTTLNAGQEELVVYLRSKLLLPLDDLLAVVHEFIEPSMSRSALDRLLRRRGHSRLPVPAKTPSAVKSFKAYEPGYVHIDVKYLPQMADETSRRYVFVAIDRATRWVFIAIKSHKTATAARSFLAALAKAALMRIKTLLTDNGREFTDRAFGARAKDASGEHGFDALCQALDIEHRLTKPKYPQTNGMVERFNGRIAQVCSTRITSTAPRICSTRCIASSGCTTTNTAKGAASRSPSPGPQTMAANSSRPLLKTGKGSSGTRQLAMPVKNLRRPLDLIWYPSFEGGACVPPGLKFAGCLFSAMISHKASLGRWLMPIN